MGRKFIDCRDVPSDSKCSLAISADTETELLEAAVQHAITVHKHQDTPELRAHIKHAMKDGTPPLQGPRHAA
jgi:predicted small metal-binding protein